MKARESSLTDSNCSPAKMAGAVSDDVRWHFKTGCHEGAWDWSVGAPDVYTLEAVRRPSSGATSRHIPVRAYSATTKTIIRVESGLEHDLLRDLDRDRQVRWIVGQPCKIEWSQAPRSGRWHIPDLLTCDAEGTVTLWNVKSPEKAKSEEFEGLTEATRAACTEVGWGHKVFTGLGPVERHNLLWLQGYRARPEWTSSWEPLILSGAEPGCQLGDLLRGGHERTAVVWHLIWSGRLEVALSVRLHPETEVHACLD